jgi:predicted nuclease of predicted toxin-antitoxin system
VRPRPHIHVDAQVSPDVAAWTGRTAGVRCTHLFSTKFKDAKDGEIFRALRNPGDVILTKDADFPRLLARHGAPPSVIWLRCGNLPDKVMIPLLAAALPKALSLLKAGETLVEIADPKPRAPRRAR